MLIRYIRNGNHRIGAIVALDADHIGWSVCNEKDEFIKAVALTKAKGYALAKAEKHLSRRPPNRDILIYDKETCLFDVVKLEEALNRMIDEMRAEAARKNLKYTQSP